MLSRKSTSDSVNLSTVIETIRSDVLLINKLVTIGINIHNTIIMNSWIKIIVHAFNYTFNCFTYWISNGQYQYCIWPNQ